MSNSENGPFSSMIYFWNMVIFHSYVSLPEGNKKPWNMREKGNCTMKHEGKRGKKQTWRWIHVICDRPLLSFVYSKNNLGFDCGYIQIKRKVLINWVAPFCVKSKPLELIQSRIDYIVQLHIPLVES
jgi:hypothetical protein